MDGRGAKEETTFDSFYLGKLSNIIEQCKSHFRLVSNFSSACPYCYLVWSSRLYLDIDGDISWVREISGRTSEVLMFIWHLQASDKQIHGFVVLSLEFL